jgi:putative ABC transport system permease protein
LRRWRIAEECGMNVLKQTMFVLAMNIRALPRRLGTASVIIIGIAGVVAVLISVLAMAAGLVETQRTTARNDRVVVVRNGASDEASSILSRAAATTAMDAPGVKHDAAGKPIASAEAIVVTSLPVSGGKTEAQAIIRGLGPNAAALRPEIHIIAGRMFQPGLNELIVGQKAASWFKGLGTGQQVSIRGTSWTVVGIFASHSAHDSALFTDAETLMSAFGKNEYQSITVQLESPESLARYQDSLKIDSSLPIEVFTERDFFTRQSAMLNTVLNVIAYVVGGIMAFGAVFAAVNVMYSAVSARAVEIATLRGIGYEPDAMIIAVMLEALALALIGGAVGALLSWLVFNGYDLSTISGGGTQLVFELAVTPRIVTIGIAWACAIGLFGGLWPALQAARLPIVVAIRSA